MLSELLQVLIAGLAVTLEAARSHLRAALCPTARMKSEHWNLFPDFSEPETSGLQCSWTSLMKSDEG